MLRIYGRPVPVYSNNRYNPTDEQMPWGDVCQLVSDGFGYGPPSQFAFNQTNCEELCRALSPQNAFQINPLQKGYQDHAPLRFVPFRMFIVIFVLTFVFLFRSILLLLAHNADDVCFNFMKMVLALPHFLNNNLLSPDLRMTREEHWNEIMKATDFSNHSKLRCNWLIQVDDQWWELFGFGLPDPASQHARQRQLWVKIFKRLRDRFLHRGFYLLKTDLQEMRQVVGNNTSDAEIIHAYLQCLAVRIRTLSNLQVA